MSNQEAIKVQDKVDAIIGSSDYISRDLSWLQFNYRVLDQALSVERTLFDRLKFLAITGSNLDEFFMIRVGSLYNYLDYHKGRVDYSGLRERPFKKKLYKEAHAFFRAQNECYLHMLKPLFEEHGMKIASMDDLRPDEVERASHYFVRTVFPMLTPMVFDSYHTFPILMNKVLIFGVVTQSTDDHKERKKLSFIQVPQNLDRFFEIEREDFSLFVPIEEIIRAHIDKLFRNIKILSVNLFRVTRNGDFTLEESDDIDANFLEELRRKLKTRRTGRVVRVETIGQIDPWMAGLLQSRWELEEDNFFACPPEGLLDYTRMWQLVKHPDFKSLLPVPHSAVPPVDMPELEEEVNDMFEVIKRKDVLLHHPYNSIDPLISLLEQAANDPDVLSIKLTIYRVAKDSRVTAALEKAAEHGKHVSVLFEVKARFDEENNLQEGERLEKAGCFVIYGVGRYKDPY